MILLPSQKMQLCFTEPGQMLLLLSAGVATCIKETEPGELPTGQREGQAGQASFAQYSHRGSDCSEICSQCLYPLKERFAEEEGNRMKRSRSEQSFSPLCHHHNQPCQNKGAAEKVQDQAFLMWLSTGFAGEAMGKPFS